MIEESRAAPLLCRHFDFIETGDQPLDIRIVKIPHTRLFTGIRQCFERICQGSASAGKGG